MARESDGRLAAPDDADESELIKKIRARTPARLLAGRAGAGYRTGTQLDLRDAHAAARDAVRVELDIESAFGAAFVQRWELSELHTRARDKEEFLLRPELGRQFDDPSRAKLSPLPRGADLQIAIGDGLSVSAVAAQVPVLLPLLCEGAQARRWTLGRPLVIHHCRVGILNEIGEHVAPRVAVLLIGERPGLATAESLSAYMAYQPRPGHSDANRNLISNIHSRGVSPPDAAARILHLAAQMMKASLSGCNLVEDSLLLEEEKGLR